MSPVYGQFFNQPSQLPHFGTRHKLYHGLEHQHHHQQQQQQAQPPHYSYGCQFNLPGNRLH